MELKPAVIKRTLPENATTLDAKRCKIQRDVKSVDKEIYDNFRSLSNNQIYIELRDGFALFGHLSREKDLADQFDHGPKLLLRASRALLWLSGPSCHGAW